MHKNLIYLGVLEVIALVASQYNYVSNYAPAKHQCLGKNFHSQAEKIVYCAQMYAEQKLMISPNSLKPTDFYYSKTIQVYHLYLQFTEFQYSSERKLYLHLNKNGQVISYTTNIDSNSYTPTEKVTTEKADWNISLSDFSRSATQLDIKKKSKINHAKYNVFDLGELKFAYEKGKSSRADHNSRKMIKEPSASYASPLGWHNTGTSRSLSLSGNNIVTFFQNNTPDSRLTVSGFKGYQFDFGLGDKPYDTAGDLHAAMTNAFYYCNLLHDVFYQFGFNEISGNFQKSNFNRGGKGGDPLKLIFTDSGSQRLPTTYTHAPDGASPQIDFHIGTSYNRLSALDDSVVVHEYFHGVADRLHGGPTAMCFPNKEYFGLNEGWSDAVSILIRIPKHVKRNYAMNIGSYTYANGAYDPPYSTDMNWNQATYSSFSMGEKVHKDGFILASAIYEVFWNLKSTLPTTYQNWRSTNIPIKKHPNTLLIQWIIDSIKLIPCQPTYLDARDALLKAEWLTSSGKYQCDIWCGFAKRGLGIDARPEPPYRNSFQVPDYCKSQPLKFKCL